MDGPSTSLGRHAAADATGPGGRFAQLFAVNALAVAQPLYDQLDRSPEFLIAHHLEGVRAVVLAVLLAVALPLVVLVADALLSLALPAAGRILQRLVLALVVAAFALQLGRYAGVARGYGAVVAALALGCGFVVATVRWPAVRSALGYLALGGVALPLVFLARLPGWGGAERSPPAAPVTATAPVVFVIFDELPLASLLDPEGGIDATFPHFAALARRTLWLRDATSVATFTTYAVPALLTGRYPTARRLPRARDYPNNLFTWLGGSYRIHAVESATGLCPPQLCPEPRSRFDLARRLGAALADLGAVSLRLTFPPDLAAELPDVARGWGGFWTPFAGSSGDAGGELEDPGVALRRFLAALEPGERVLSYLHLNLPHGPWRYLPSGARYVRGGGSPPPPGLLAGERWSDDPWAALQAEQRHLMQVAYADRLLGELVAGLERAGLWERALIVVTSDHGVSFVPGTPYREPAAGNLAAVLPVPLFVKPPGLAAPAVRDLPVETIDVLPTVARLLGSELPWPVDGHPALDATPADRPRRFSHLGSAGASTALEPVGSLAEALRRLVEHRVESFGSAAGEDGLFAIGEPRELLGTATDELAVGTAEGWSAELVDGELFGAVAPGSGFLPARLEGWLEAPADVRRPVRLAIAVDGVVRALTRTVASRRGPRFSALLPESALPSGAHRVEVLAIEGEGAGRRLTRVRRRDGV